MPRSRITYELPSDALGSVLREDGIEAGFIGTLQDVKYDYRPDITNRAALEKNFREKLEALNRVRLTDAEFARLPDEILTPDVIPHAEQQRIADCLTALDDLIAAQTQKLEALKTHKQGLMQQLFPSPEEVGGMSGRFPASQRDTAYQPRATPWVFASTDSRVLKERRISSYHQTAPALCSVPSERMVFAPSPSVPGVAPRAGMRCPLEA